MTATVPLVSIGMPVRNCQQTLALALRSLLAQTFTDWELLLIDDGSSDNTPRVAGAFSDPRVKLLVDGTGRGLPCRLNQAIDLSRGRYFARMDGDDIAYPTRLERQVEFLEQHPGIDLAGAWAMVFREGGIALGKRTGATAHAQICAHPFSGFPLSHPTYIGRVTWFRRYRYRVEAVRCEDQDLLLRSYRFSQFANVPEILLGYREDRIDLRKLLPGRRSHARCAGEEARRQGRFARVPLIFGEQLAKGLADCVAATTGLGHTLLRHRALPVTDAERDEWTRIWRLVQGEPIR